MRKDMRELFTDSVKELGTRLLTVHNDAIELAYRPGRERLRPVEPLVDALGELINIYTQVAAGAAMLRSVKAKNTRGGAMS